MENILVIDDQEINIKVLRILLEKEGYNILTAISGKDALKIIENSCENYISLILADINMPNMSGFELCEIIKTNEKYQNKCKNTPIIFISALANITNIIEGFEKGAVDYITKPFNTKEVILRVKNHLKIRNLQAELATYNEKLEEKVKEQIEKIEQTQMATIFSLAKLAQSRDDDTGKHLERVQTLCKYLSEELAKNSKYSHIINKEYINNIFHASPLHDIGKVGISDLILLKKGRLTQEEFEVMKTHSEIGAKTLEEVNENYKGNAFIEMGILIARHHHEKWDGSGYPCGLKGNEIPLCARIMSIVDVYDALKSKRVYKEAFEQEKCIEIIKENSGTQFDPDIVECFLNISDKIYKTWLELQD